MAALAQSCHDGRRTAALREHPVDALCRREHGVGLSCPPPRLTSCSNFFGQKKSDLAEAGGGRVCALRSETFWTNSLHGLLGFARISPGRSINHADVIRPPLGAVPIPPIPPPPRRIIRRTRTDPGELEIVMFISQGRGLSYFALVK